MELLDRFKKYASGFARDLRDLAGSELTFESAEANVGGQKLRFRANVERSAAWEMYIELATRISTQPLLRDEGLIREALDSLHVLFSITREILKRAGPAVASRDESLGMYAVSILNHLLRPFLAKWHPLLKDWEDTRPSGTSVVAHEKRWANCERARAELERVRRALLSYCEALGKMAGVPEGVTRTVARRRQ